MLRVVHDAAEIRALRKRLGLDRSAFARLVGVDARTVSRWESEKGPRPKGAAAAVVTGIREQLEGDPKSAKKVVRTLAGAAAVGGLAYLMVKLLKKAADSGSES